MTTADSFTKHYLNLINIHEIELPSLDYLSKLQKNHIEKLGWDTIDLFLGRSIELSPTLILERFLKEQRGGVCYELNGAFCHLLNRLGFNAYLASAYAHGYNDDVFEYKIDTHIVIILKLAEKNYLVDVGWGDSYRAPVLLEDQNQFSDTSGEYQLHLTRQNPFRFELNKFYNSKWRKQYDFSLIPSELPHFYQNLNIVYHDPAHEVHRKLNCIKPNNKGYVAITNNELIIKIDDNIEKTPLAYLNDLKNILAHKFSIKESFVMNYF